MMRGAIDRELVAAAQGGDRDALDVLLRRHYDLVHAVCRRIAGGTRDADDAAQEAMIGIVRGLPRSTVAPASSTWMYRIATNAALDELRRRRRRPTLHVVDDDGPPREEADPVAHRRVDAVVDRLALDDALRRLPEEFRAAVVLRDVADLDYAEIAEVLEVPLGTVKSRIARGRAQLVAMLGNCADLANVECRLPHPTTRRRAPRHDRPRPRCPPPGAGVRLPRRRARRARSDAVEADGDLVAEATAQQAVRAALADNDPPPEAARSRPSPPPLAAFDAAPVSAPPPASLAACRRSRWLMPAAAAAYRRRHRRRCRRGRQRRRRRRRGLERRGAVGRRRRPGGGPAATAAAAAATMAIAAQAAESTEAASADAGESESVAGGALPVAEPVPALAYADELAAFVAGLRSAAPAPAAQDTAGD